MLENIPIILAITALILTIFGKWWTKAYADRKIDWEELPDLLNELYNDPQLREKPRQILTQLGYVKP